MTRRVAAPRKGFTLIEVMVVVGIIAVLMALLIPAVNRVRESVRRTQVASDVAQISNAIQTFKAKMKVEHIPAFGDTVRNPHTTNGQLGGTPDYLFRLRSSYGAPPTGTPPNNWPDNPDNQSAEAVYLKRVFPQMDLSSTGLPNLNLDPNQTLMFFLTGGTVTNYAGFSLNKQYPGTAPAVAGEQRLGPFLEVNPGSSKIDSAGHYLDPWGTPYAYFAWEAPLNNYPTGSGSTPMWPTTGSANAPGGLSAFSVGGKFLNPKGFQIVCAGKDKLFGPGGNWVPGTGLYISGQYGADDMSNFNEGPLNEQR